MIFPHLLHKSDLVAVTATSSPCKRDALENGVRALEGMGLRVRVMDSCYATHEYLAGYAELRVQDLHLAFSDKEVKGIFAARGGYGAGRLLPLLDYGMIQRNAKVFVGFSDVTALHVALNQVCRMVTFHGPMAGSCFGGGELDTASMEAFKRAVFGCKWPQTAFTTIYGDERNSRLRDAAPADAISTRPHAYSQGNAAVANTHLTVLHPGCASGILTGGNLSVIASLLGTPYEIKTRGRILFLEEIGETPYRVDRLLLQLKLAGKFRDAEGIVFGDFVPETLETLNLAIRELVLPEGKPTLWGLPCGHSLPNITLPLGLRAYISQAGFHRFHVPDAGIKL